MRTRPFADLCPNPSAWGLSESGRMGDHAMWSPYPPPRKMPPPTAVALAEQPTDDLQMHVQGETDAMQPEALQLSCASPLALSLETASSPPPNGQQQCTAQAWDTFMVSLSEGVSAVLADQNSGSGGRVPASIPSEAALRLDTFCSSVRQALSPLLPTPTSHAPPKATCTRQHRQLVTTTPRRSVRLAKGLGRASNATKQQQIIIRRLCLAHEGDQIGDEALEAYVHLFDNPLTDGQIAAILALFGWESPASPLQDVEVDPVGRA